MVAKVMRSYLLSHLAPDVLLHSTYDNYTSKIPTSIQLIFMLKVPLVSNAEVESRPSSLDES